MSGLEVAGLVLGAFPIALEVLDRYKEAATRFGFWKNIKAKHKECHSLLKFHQLSYMNNLKLLLLPLTGLNDTRIDELLRNPGGKAWTEAGTVSEVLEKRLGDSYDIYLQCIGDFKKWLEAMNHKLAFDPETKLHRESLSAVSQLATSTLDHRWLTRNNKSRSTADIVKDQAKWQFYRFRFSQAEKERTEIFAKLASCNDRLSKLLKISGDDVQLVQERVSKGNGEINAICRFWRQAGRVFTALSTVWNCNCRAQHSAGLLLEHRTSTTSEFHLLYDKGAQGPQEARRIMITAKCSEYNNSPVIKLSSHRTSSTYEGQVATNNPNHRASTPKRSAMRKITGSTIGESRYGSSSCA